MVAYAGIVASASCYPHHLLCFLDIPIAKDFSLLDGTIVPRLVKTSRLQNPAVYVCRFFLWCEGKSFFCLKGWWCICLAIAPLPKLVLVGV